MRSAFAGAGYAAGKLRDLNYSSVCSPCPLAIQITGSQHGAQHAVSSAIAQHCAQHAVSPAIAFHSNFVRSTKHLFTLNSPSGGSFKQYSTSASGVGKGYSHGWCSAVATRPEAEWRRQQHPWEYPLPTPLARVLYCFYKTIL